MKLSAATAKEIALENRKRLPEHLHARRDAIMKSIFSEIKAQAEDSMFMANLTLAGDMRELGVEDGMHMLLEVGHILASLGYKTSEFNYYRPEINIYWE